MTKKPVHVSFLISKETNGLLTDYTAAERISMSELICRASSKSKLENLVK